MMRYLLALSCALLLVACGQPEESEEPKADTAGTEQEYVDRMAEEHADDSTAASDAVKLGEVPAQPVLSEETTYGMIQGEPLTGYLAYPETAHGGMPGILLFHEWWGLNDNIRAMADKLAGQGYVVLAVDLYDDQVAADPAEARELMQATMANRERLNRNISLAWKFMEEEIGALSTAAMGWCLGGSMAMNTALLYPQQLDALVIYYGHVTDVSPEQLAELKMPILGLFGAEDRGIPVDGVERFRDQLNALGKDATIVIYDDAGHAFANPTGSSYQADAAEDAWDRTLKFLDRSLNAAVNRNVLAEDELPTLPEVGETEAGEGEAPDNDQ
ncbi:MAG: dienelactone hydrolase family protein [Gammaproteobacteria bacterium]|nr:dienelactone hydrolase family protein [Gammaproteobacteria bacterium]